MAVKVETLELEIRSQAFEASKGIDALVTSLSKLKRATGMMNIVKLTHNMVSLNAALKTLDDSAIGKMEKLAAAMEKVATASEKIRGVGAIGKNVKSLNNALKETPTGASSSILHAMPQATKGMTKDYAGGTNAMDIGKAMAQMTTFSFKAGLVASTVEQKIGGALSAVGGVAQKVLPPLSSAMVKVAGVAGRAGRAIASAIGQKVGNKVKSLTKSFTGLFNSLKRIAMYRLLRSMIKSVTEGFTEGIKAVSRYSRTIGGEFSQTMDKLATQLSVMKGSLGAMAAPLIEALAPAIMVVTNAVINLANALNQLFSLMSGKNGWTMCISAADQYDDSVQGATKSQKALTAGMDELNVLSDNNSGGGSGVADYKFAEQELSSWASKLKEFFSVGDYLGGGSYLADVMNKLVDGWNAEEWGKKLGKRLQNAVSVAYGFLTKIDTSKIGSKIAKSLNSMFEQINFNMVGKTLSEKWNRLIDLIRGFATSFNWKGFGQDIADFVAGAFEAIDVGNIASTISSLVTGALNMVMGFLEGINWVDFGATIAQKIRDFVANVDFEGIVVGAYKLIGELIGAYVSMMYGFIDGAVTAIGEYLESHTLGEIITDLFNLVMGAVTGFLSGIDTIVGTNMAGTFENALSSIGQFFADTWNGIVEIWSGVATWFNDWVITPLVNFFTPIFTVVGQIFSGLWLIIQAVWVTVATWFNETVIVPLVNFFSPIVAKISGFFSTIWEAIKKVWNTVSQWFNTTVIQPLVTVFEPIVEKIGGIFDRLWEGIKKGVVSAMNFVIDKIEAALNGIIDLINGLLSGFNSVVSWAGEVLEKDWSDIGRINHVSFPRLANGGSVGAGDLFMANENGAELISSSQSRTSVMSNDDVVRAVSMGVYDAVVSAMSQSNGKSQSIQVFLNGKQIEASTRETKQRRGATIASGGIYNYA